MSKTKLNDRRVINGWAFFDWANSSFALVITAAIFPAYYMQVTNDVVQVGPFSMPNSSLYAYAVSAAYLILALASPFLSGIADSSGRKKFFLRAFTYLGAVSCFALFFFKGTGGKNPEVQLLLGTGSYMLATIGFAGGLVFYNAYLPEIVTEDRYDKVSARGFAFGYIGSVILLVFSLLMISKYTFFGFADKGVAVRFSFVLVALWWLGFSMIPFRRLPPDSREKAEDDILRRGWQELKKVWHIVKGAKNIKRFLIAFFAYSAGVQTVLILAATFAEKELSFGASELVLIILVLQLVAIAGAYLFAGLSAKRGNKFSLMVLLVLWMLICTAAYFVQTKEVFYLIAGGVGMVMGGVQSMSRSTFSKLLPENTEDNTSFFSFYDVLEKLSIVTGTFAFGLAEHLTGGIRNSLLPLIAFFLIGLFFLLRTRVQAVGVEENL